MQISGVQLSGVNLREAGTVAQVTAFRAGNWTNLAWLGTFVTGTGSAHIEFLNTDPIYSALAGVAVGSSITINITITSRGTTTIYNGTVTVTEAISAGGTANQINATHKIKVSGNPNNNQFAGVVSGAANGDPAYITYTPG
jgi:hypothetical protein